MNARMARRSIAAHPSNMTNYEFQSEGTAEYPTTARARRPDTKPEHQESPVALGVDDNNEPAGSAQPPTDDLNGMTFNDPHGRPHESDADPLLGIDRLLTTAQAAVVLQIPVRTLEYWRSERGQGAGPPFVRMSSSIRYRLRDLEGFIESRVVYPRAS